MRISPIAVLALGLAPMLSFAEGRNITIETVDGRHWLIGPDGKPFFAHGITHLGLNVAKEHRGAVAEAAKELGFNAFGYGCAPDLKSEAPYCQGWNNLVPISLYHGEKQFRYRDIFDPAVQQSVRADIKKSCLENRDNPNLIGYMWTDLPVWPLKNKRGVNWVEFTRALPVGAAGRREYVRFLRNQYSDVAAFNTVYKTKVANWDALLDHDFGDLPAKPAIAKDDQAFLLVIAREYYALLGKANKEFDPNHLIFGDRIAPFIMDEDVIKEMLPWIDAVALQPHFAGGFPKDFYDRLHKLADKPIIICDFAVRFKDGEKNIRGGRLEANDDVAGQRYSEYILEAVATPYVLGAFWCNPIDSHPPGKAGVKQGLFGTGMTPRPDLPRHMKELNQRLKELTPSER